MINTSQGPKIPADALGILKSACSSAGELLGIFKQLEGYPEGALAAAFIVANPGSYSDKLQRLALEKKTGRTVGAKVINSMNDLTQILHQCGRRAQIRITIRKDVISGIRRLLTLENFEIESNVRMLLLCVASSNAWEKVPRTFLATISLADPLDFGSAMAALKDVAEKIEVVVTLEDRVKVIRTPDPFSDEVKATLAANPDLFYDRSLFLQVCAERTFARQQERVDELSNQSTMEEVLLLFLHNSTRVEFLDFYLARFCAVMA